VYSLMVIKISFDSESPLTSRPIAHIRLFARMCSHMNFYVIFLFNYLIETNQKTQQLTRTIIKYLTEEKCTTGPFARVGLFSSVCSHMTIQSKSLKLTQFESKILTNNYVFKADP
jgi:hypothetical protein